MIYTEHELNELAQTLTPEDKRRIVETFDQLFEAVDIHDYQQYQTEMHGIPGDDE